MYAFLLEILRIKEITTYPMECNTIHTITFENISKFIKVSLIRLFCNTQCICYIFLQTLLGKMLTWHLDVYYVRCVLLLYYLFFCLLGITQCYRMCSLRYLTWISCKSSRKSTTEFHIPSKSIALSIFNSNLSISSQILWIYLTWNTSF